MTDLSIPEGANDDRPRTPSFDRAVPFWIAASGLLPAIERAAVRGVGVGGRASGVFAGLLGAIRRISRKDVRSSVTSKAINDYADAHVTVVLVIVIRRSLATRRSVPVPRLEVGHYQD
jgi:uncharacterized membrane protein